MIEFPGVGPIDVEGLGFEHLREVEIDGLDPAEYNPREIDEEALDKLRASLRDLGLIKPVICTEQNKILAGHQRTKGLLTLGIDRVPAFVLPRLAVVDEVRFNQLHNASDLEAGGLSLRIRARHDTGFVVVGSEEITGDISDGDWPRAKRTEILRMVVAYGQWGSIVATRSGEILVSNLYASACRILRRPALAFIVPDDRRELVLHHFSQKYGRFSYEHLPKDTWAQTWAQPKRIRGKTQTRSLNYKVLAGDKAAAAQAGGILVPPTRTDKILDFGAGYMDHAKELKKAGYSITAYEPFFKKGAHTGHNDPPHRGKLWPAKISRDVDRLIRELDEHGRFDYVNCDFVLNSVDSVQAEQDVLACVSALCRPGGYVLWSGRSRSFAEALENAYATSDGGNDWLRRGVEFIDDNGFSGTWGKGTWRYQKFHWFHEIEELTRRYIGDRFVVTNHDLKPVAGDDDLVSSRSFHVFATKSVRLDREATLGSLMREFSFPLPGMERGIDRGGDVQAAWLRALEREVVRDTVG